MEVADVDPDKGVDVDEQAEEHDTEDQERTDRPEPTENTCPETKKKSAGTPSMKLHVYTAEELSQFKKKGLLADVALLDGQSDYLSFVSQLYE